MMFLVEGNNPELKQEDAFNARPFFEVSFGKYPTYLLKPRQIVFSLRYKYMYKYTVTWSTRKHTEKDSYVDIFSSLYEKTPRGVSGGQEKGGCFLLCSV